MTIGKEMCCLKRKDKVGANPKGQRRPERPMTAGGHRRHPGAGGFLKRLSRYIGDERLFGMLLSVKRGKMEKSEATKGRRHPVRQDEAGEQRRHSIPGGFGKREAAFLRGRQNKIRRKESEWIKRQAGVGATPKGQRRPVRPHDSWRAPTPFWSGLLCDVEIH